MAKKLMTTGRYEDVAAELTGRYLSGSDGKGVALREVRVGETTGDNPALQLEFVCEVGGLKEKYSDEYEPIEPTTVSALITLKNPQQMAFDKLSRSLGLGGDDKLLDDGEDWMRLIAPDHPKTLVPKLAKAENLYLSISVKPDAKDPDKAGAVYFNLESPPVRKSNVSYEELKKRYGKPAF